MKLDRSYSLKLKIKTARVRNVVYKLINAKSACGMPRERDTLVA